MMRVRSLLSVLALLAATGPALAAREAPLRSFTAPPGRDDGRPAPSSAPRGAVEQRLLPPPGSPVTGEVPADMVFALACSAADAALVAPNRTKASGTKPAKPLAKAPCAEPFTIIVEQP